MTDLARVKTISDIASAWVAIVGLGVGGAFALLEYNEQNHDERIKATISYVTRFNSASLSDDRSSMFTALQQKNDEIHDVLESGEPQEVIDERYYRLVVNVVRENERAFLEILTLLDELATCVESGLCDRETADTYFLKYGRSFFRTYYPYVCELRSRWSDGSIAGNLERYFNPATARSVCV